MLDQFIAFQHYSATLPMWVQMWMKIMQFTFALSIPFSFVRVEARWVLLAMLGAIFTSLWIQMIYGFEGIMNLGHIITLVPLLIYLFLRRSKWDVSKTWSGKWIVAVFFVTCVTLVFDTRDVTRWLIANLGA